MAATTSTSSTDPVSSTVEMSDLESANKAKGGPESMSQNTPSASAEPGGASTSNAILTPESNGQKSAGGGDDEEQSRISGNTPVAAAATTATTASPTPAESELQPSATDSITPGGAAPAATTSSSDASGPICIITLLLTSGARHPYKLDEKYLMKRNVNVPGTTENGKKDPFSISVYTLKELILREWRDEWEVQPSSPSSIRLIHFGRLLDDKMPLKECRFNTDSPNVVHMTVKPQEVVDEEDASKGKAMGRDGAGSERTAGCRCTIM